MTPLQAGYTHTLENVEGYGSFNSHLCHICSWNSEPNQRRVMNDLRKKVKIGTEV